MTVSLNEPLSLIARAKTHQDRTAIIAGEGTFTYRQLLQASHRVAVSLLKDRNDLEEARVAFLVPPGFHYVATQWGIWRAGGIAVPLAIMHPPPEWAYVIDDCGATLLVAHPDFIPRLRPLAEQRGLRLLPTVRALQGARQNLPRVGLQRRAMIVYTSGTTGKPKGVVTTHRNIEAQVTSLTDAWEWTHQDHILHVLPLHHIHGIINVLTCALWAGATCEILPRFDASVVWERITRGHLTLFMAVPTIYARLIAAWEAAPASTRKAMSAACTKLRLMVSGSAALPVATLKKWHAISGHVLLERYGMTEIGMALSNPLHGERRPASVGTPLPHVRVRLVDEQGNPLKEGNPGEIEVRGPGVFLAYWGKPEETRQAFRDGWFRTGDMAVVEEGRYRILGRQSVDIIKIAGYKVSALEIEEVLRAHPAIAECAVVGIPDLEYGERVGVALILQPDRVLTLEALQQWTRERLAPYKVPSRMIVLNALPRNALGKVTKPQVVRLFHHQM